MNSELKGCGAGGMTASTAPQDMGQPLVGRLVQVDGSGRCRLLATSMAPDQELQEPLNVDLSGRLFGQCYGWDSAREEYLVVTFEGHVIGVREGDLVEFVPPSLESGGFDIAWPAEGGDHTLFSEELAGTVARKGYCLIQMSAGSLQAQRTAMAAAVQQERKRGVQVMKSEVEAAWLGKDNSSKIVVLEDKSPERVLDDTLLWCDRQLTHLSLLLRPVTRRVLGFDNWGRSRGYVRLRDQDASTEHWADCLEEEDVEDGTVEQLISIVGEGGQLSFFPREGSGLEAATIPITANRLLVFRHDLMDYSYRPEGDSLALQAWLLQAPPLATASHARVGAESLNEVLGITGPQEPEGAVGQILSLGLRLPGCCNGYSSLCALFTCGSEAQTEVTIDRWDSSVYYTTESDAASKGKTNAKHAGFLSIDELKCFDHTFFGISKEEAEVVAPEQRLVLQTGYEAFEGAGLTKDDLTGRRIGIYTGDCAGEFSNQCHALNRFRFTGATNAATASRLSHVYGLRGAAYAFDTACSSSLVALGHAHMVLRSAASQEAEASEISAGGLGPSSRPARPGGALVVGIRVLLGPDAFVGLGAGGFLGPHGRCLTFDGSANGFGRGEGCCALFLRVSNDAVDVDSRLACLLGTSVNQDGRSASMTAPHGPSQQDCIRDSMSMGRIVPGSVTVAECHGTGTSLGDPIEVGALRGVMHDRDELPLMLTSSKSNIGHGESAAGLNGLAKCVLMCLASTAPPNVHLRSFNPHLDTDGFPCLFESECTDVGRNSQYIGVSSFGFGGTNARADLWGRCQLGPRATRPDLSRCEYVDLPCPRCLGRMCWMCGVAVPEYSNGRIHRCSLVRDGGGYDYCSNCYSGGYLFGQPDESGLQALDDRNLFVIGSWSAWSVLHEVEQIGDGVYVFAAALSETLCERFHFLLKGDDNLALYPSTDRAGMASRITGPDASANGRSWIIDGRRDKKPAGTVYKVTLTWNAATGEKRVEWEATGAYLPKCIDPKSYEHDYYILGSWTGGDFQRMTLVSAKQSLYEATFRVGVTGEEEFQFSRDRDSGQVIHPASARAQEEFVLTRGPDDGGRGRCWLATGQQGEIVKVHLQVREGHITVTLNPGTKSERVWESGREAQSFFLTGPFNGWGFSKMTAEAGHGKAGVHRYRLSLGNSGRQSFQLAIDEDPSRKLYPASTDAESGEGILEGPCAVSHKQCWLVRGKPKSIVEVVLDTTQQDHRQMVWWREVE